MQIGNIKGRVFAHKNRVKLAQRAGVFRAKGKMIVRFSAQLDPAGSAHGARAFNKQVGHFQIPDLMATRLGLKHENKGGVFVDQDVLNRVHNKGETQLTHKPPLPRIKYGASSGPLPPGERE